ncbi:MAG TPA: hypothetical protein VF600_02730 [Abditibacteriaceae bacterium]|jgi:hypothetical protein
MYQLQEITEGDQLRNLMRDSSVPCVEFQKLQQYQPDAVWVLLENCQVIARCALWWSKTPCIEGERTGALGCYAARDEMGALGLLHHVCRELAARGCTQAVGPMDGNTWRNYRFVTERGEEPPFFLEPHNAVAWPGHFVAAGFTPLAHYSSTLCTDLAREDPRLGAVATRLEASGVAIRTLQMQDFKNELRRIYGVCVRSFRKNFLYLPIAEQEFIEQYAALIPFINPELVLLAEREEQVVGFSFALPDASQSGRGEDINTAILKTVAVLPGRDYAGLGNFLTARTHAIAHCLGFTRVIHALMHNGNASRTISAFYGQPLRGYTLYSKSLT